MSKLDATESISIVRDFLSQHFQKRNVSIDKKFCADDVKIHCPVSWHLLHSSEIDGINAASEIDDVYCSAFEVTNFEIEDIFSSISDPLKVSVRWGVEGLHVNDYFGLKATNKTFMVTGISIYTLNEQGKIAEVWQSWDMLGLLDQIGVLQLTIKS